MREVEEVRHELMMLSEEGAEPLELGLHVELIAFLFLFPIDLLCFPSHL